jgi:transcriptional regulator with XRE-family HTH domain
MSFYIEKEYSATIKASGGTRKMDQLVTGKFIAQKRKEKSLTQEQLAEKLGVSNKTISKWETGKCMPDYAVVKSLCKELEITVAELMDGEEAEEKSVQTYDDAQIMDLLRRTQELEKQKCILSGILLIVMGMALQALSYTIGGSSVKDFFSGLLLGMSIVEMLVGTYVTARYSIMK